LMFSLMLSWLGHIAVENLVPWYTLKSLTACQQDVFTACQQDVFALLVPRC
jgi:hypothetical protein